MKMFRMEEASTFRPRNAMTSAITHLPGSSKQANVLVGAGCPYPAGDIKFYVDAARSFAAHGLHRDKLKPWTVLQTVRTVLIVSVPFLVIYMLQPSLKPSQRRTHTRTSHLKETFRFRRPGP